jgi:exopolysaccharide biosynthesis polyprenyl glycosylphosphotransferase
MVTTRRYILSSLFKIFDLALLLGSFIAAAVPSLSAVGATSLTDFLSMRISVRNFLLFSGLLLLWHSLFSFFGLYESKRFSNQSREAIDVSKATSLGTLVLFLVGILFNLSVIHPLFLAVFWLISTGTSVLSRGALRFLLKRIRQRGRNTRQVLIVGTNPRAIDFAREIEAHPELGCRIIGFADEDWDGAAGVEKAGYRLVCTLSNFREFLRRNVIDEVAIALPMQSCYRETLRIKLICEEQGLIIRFLSNIVNPRLGHTQAEDFAGIPFITLYPGSPRYWSLFVKRVLDFTLALIGVVLVAPVFLVVPILIKLTSPGPVFFIQKRLGLNKRIFCVYKFRTMVADAEQRLPEVEHLNEVSGPVFKIKDDPRVTRLGKFLRKTSIDELPQLFNVLKGEMSLVGPRAMQLRDCNGFEQDWHRRRFSVPPGITCLWQVNGRSSIPFEKWMELDMEYIDKWSLWLDLQILVKTIPAVLKGTGAA